MGGEEGDDQHSFSRLIAGGSLATSVCVGGVSLGLLPLGGWFDKHKKQENTENCRAEKKKTSRCMTRDTKIVVALSAKTLLNDGACRQTN